MSEKGKANLIKYGSSALFVAVMAGLYIALRDFAGAELVDKFRYLTDAFTIPAGGAYLSELLLHAVNVTAKETTRAKRAVAVIIFFIIQYPFYIKIQSQYKFIPKFFQV